MPQFDFDVTEEANAYAIENMQTLVGNEGQQALLDSIGIDSYAIVHVYIAGDSVDVKPEYDIQFSTGHPDAIEDIIDLGEQSFQEFAERSADILNLIDEAWKALG